MTHGESVAVSSVVLTPASHRLRRRSHCPWNDSRRPDGEVKSSFITDLVSLIRDQICNERVLNSMIPVLISFIAVRNSIITDQNSNSRDQSLIITVLNSFIRDRDSIITDRNSNLRGRNSIITDQSSNSRDRNSIDESLGLNWHPRNFCSHNRLRRKAPIRRKAAASVPV